MKRPQTVWAESIKLALGQWPTSAGRNPWRAGVRGRRPATGASRARAERGHKSTSSGALAAARWATGVPSRWRMRN